MKNGKQQRLGQKSAGAPLGKVFHVDGLVVRVPVAMHMSGDVSSILRLARCLLLPPRQTRREPQQPVMRFVEAELSLRLTKAIFSTFPCLNDLPER